MAKKKITKVLGWRKQLDAKIEKLRAAEPPPPPPPEPPVLRPANKENIILELRRIAYFDPRRLFDEEGKPRPITELEDDVAAAVGGLEAIEQYDWDRASPETKRKVLSGMLKKYRITDKLHALELLDRIDERGGGANAKDHLRAIVDALKDPENRR